MRILYGSRFPKRYRALASAIPPGCGVVDVCCGDAYLYRHYLTDEPLSYLGLDINAGFVRWLMRRGVPVRQFDLRSETIPEADIVMMQSSLYQFIPDEKAVLDKMISAARRYVILTEPVSNLSASSNPLLAWLGKRLTDPGTGEAVDRFDEERLRRLLESYKTDIFEPIAGGREILARIVV